MPNTPPNPEAKLPPRVWVSLHTLPGGVRNDGEPQINAHACTEEEREYYKVNGYSEPADLMPYTPESLLLAERERCRREVQEACVREIEGWLDPH